MEYIKINSDQTSIYPYNLRELKTENPYTSFPESIEDVASEYNVFLVNETAQPTFNSKTQKVILDEPEYKNGQYYQSWQVVSQTLDEAKSNANNRINSDWFQIEAQGWDTGLPQGHLGITPDDVALISGAFALAKEAANLGLPIPSLVTIENNELSFNNINEMLQLMLLYGQARLQMSTQIAFKRKAVENATTIEELEGI